MELELSLSPPNQKRKPTKKSFHGRNDDQCSIVTRFPLVSWDQDEDDEPQTTFFNGDYQKDLEGDKECLIGWPPLHSWRKHFIEENHIGGVGFNGGQVDEEGGGNINVMNNHHNNSLFVKVKMDGVGIPRKIDLNSFHSYQMLTITLMRMFHKSYVEFGEGGSTYKLMYQHKDGQWLLAEDLPWETFINTVQRIQMVKNYI